MVFPYIVIGSSNVSPVSLADITIEPLHLKSMHMHIASNGGYIIRYYSAQIPIRKPCHVILPTLLLAISGFIL